MISLRPESIPDKAVPYILFQRTSLLRIPRTSLYRKISRFLPKRVYESIVAIEGRIWAQEIKQAYVSEIEAEFETVRKVLPGRCSSVLDIGCGIAAIDALIAEHYASLAPHIWLLDKTATDPVVHYGFRDRGAFYNSLETAVAVMGNCGVGRDRVSVLEVSDTSVPDLPDHLDLVISLISWGFHYPVATYLDAVAHSLRAGGSLILDVRRGTDGLDVLRKRFARVEVVMATPKFDRVLACDVRGSTP